MSYIGFLFLVLITVSSAKRSSRSVGCSFTIPSDVPENEPVYLTRTSNNSYQLYEPVDKINLLQPGHSLHLFCPGNQNSVQILRRNKGTVSGSTVIGANMTRLECNRQSKFEVNGGVATELNRLNCTKSVMGDLLTTPHRCGPRSEAVINQLGFRLDRGTFIPMVNSCYNNRSASAQFVRYKINGKAIKYNVKESERRSFRDNGIPAAVNANDAFKKNNQIAYFDSLLGNQQNFINSTSYLSRGHLAADADFVFSSGQFATYFYVNVVPQFQQINGGNWLRVEKIARNLAMNYATELTIYTGSLGQLKLPSAVDNKQKAIYLHANSKIIVPQWTYKVIVDERAATAIAFVTSNNPFLHRSAARPFCEDVCQRAGLDMKQFSDVRKGFTFCCEYQAFMQQVDITPFSHRIQRLLSCANVVLTDDE